MSEEAVKTECRDLRLKNRMILFVTTPLIYAFFRLAYIFTHSKDDKWIYENAKYLFKSALKGITIE
jgi:hypothetical protein